MATDYAKLLRNMCGYRGTSFTCERPERNGLCDTCEAAKMIDELRLDSTRLDALLKPNGLGRVQMRELKTIKIPLHGDRTCVEFHTVHTRADIDAVLGKEVDDGEG